MFLPMAGIGVDGFHRLIPTDLYRLLFEQCLTGIWQLHYDQDRKDAHEKRKGVGRLRVVSQRFLIPRSNEASSQS